MVANGWTRAGDGAAGEPARGGPAARDGRIVEFLDGLRATAEAACDLGHWFALVSVQPAPGDELSPIARHLGRLAREYDAVLVAAPLALVLLADTSETGALDFIDRLIASAPCHREPRIEHRCFPPGLAEADAAVRWALSRLEGAGVARGPAAHARAGGAGA